jgi:hypothetical protein
MTHTQAKQYPRERIASDTALQRLIENGDAAPFPPTASGVFLELGVIFAACLALALLVNVVLPWLGW